MSIKVPWFSLIVVGICFLASTVGALAQQPVEEMLDITRSESGLVIIFAPDASGQELMLKTEQGDVISQASSDDPLALRYLVSPGEYRIFVPGSDEPISFTARPGGSEVINLSHPDAIEALRSGEIKTAPVERIDPPDNTILLTTNPRPGTDDPGPMRR